MKNSFIRGMLTACILTLIGVYSCEEYYIGKKYLENLESSGKFDIEILEQPKKESKEKPKPKKKKASPKKGDK